MKPLTAREHQILTLAADGLSNKQIAAHLRVSIQTIKNTLAHTYVKLDALNRAQATARLGRGEVVQARPTRAARRGGHGQ